MENKLESNRQNYRRKPTNPTIRDIIDESERLMLEGNRRNAYELSLKATQIDPQNVEAWWLRANLAPSPEERMMSVNRLNELAPELQDQHHLSFFTIREAIERDPFLAYHGETDDLYRAVNAEQIMLSIPKQRAPVEPFPPERPSPLRAAYRWLVLAFFGLLLAGLGSLVFAPLAALSARQVKPSLKSRSEQVNANVVITLSLLILLLGLNFAFLFLIHWLG